MFISGEDEDCFKKKSVQTLMSFLIIFIVGLAVAMTVLSYYILKLKNKLAGLVNPTKSSTLNATSSTAFKG